MYIGKTASILVAAALLTGCTSSDDDNESTISSPDVVGAIAPAENEAITGLPTNEGDATITPPDEAGADSPGENGTVSGLPTGEDDGDTNGTSMPAPDFNPNGGTQALTQFNGNYLMSCAQDPDDDEIWSVNELSIQGDLYTATLTEYSDSECAEPSRTFESTLSAVYPGGTANTTLGTADFLNLTLESGSVNGSSITVPSDSFFDLILLDGNNLYFGLNTETLDGDSAEARPIDIDTETIFVRL